jgi:hypothetical protein
VFWMLLRVSMSMSMSRLKLKLLLKWKWVGGSVRTSSVSIAGRPIRKGWRWCLYWGLLWQMPGILVLDLLISWSIRRLFAAGISRTP